MFVGHYAAAFALKGKEKSLSLGALFLAVQFVDILFFPFVLAGIEHLKFEEHYTAVNNFNMYFYPFTHGFAGTLFWSVLWYFLYYYGFAKAKKNRWKIALFMALAVLSHWFADVIVHTPDLPIIYGEPKLGFGLWYSKSATFAVEAILLFLGLYYYLKKTKPINNRGKYLAVIFVFFLIFVNYLNMYVLPENNNIVSLTISALFFYFLFAWIASYVDKFRM